MKKEVVAEACANIALVKYWGKRDALLNLPATGSLSLTLAALLTQTSVTFDDELARDRLVVNQVESDATRTSALLDIVRQRAGVKTRALVSTRNNFPTASGLASSASGFAALALAASLAVGIELTPKEHSILARRGSGSAARSVFGGFVRMHAGSLASGEDSFAEPIESLLVERVRMVIAVVGGGVKKKQGSRDAMELCAETSPLYPSWIAQVPRDLKAAEAAIRAGDLEALGTIAEANAFAMHATAIASRPAIVYWQPTTIALFEAVRQLREEGVHAWATMDAGPHVKVLTTPGDAPKVAAALGEIEGVTTTISTAGGPVRIFDDKKVEKVVPVRLVEEKKS